MRLEFIKRFFYLIFSSYLMLVNDKFSIKDNICLWWKITLFSRTIFYL